MGSEVGTYVDLFQVTTFLTEGKDLQVNFIVNTVHCEECTSLVPYGSNLSSTINYPKLSSAVRNIMNIPPQLYSIFVGLLMSDAWLQRPSIKRNARFGLKQSLEHAKYFWSVFLKLSHFCSSSPYIAKRIFNGKTFYAYGFTTRSLPCITELHNLFYVNGKKIVPFNLFEILTPEALAHWIMGDGSRTGGGLTLNTQSFTIKDVVFIMNVLTVKYNLKCTLHMQRNQPVIYISAKSMPIVRALISPYLHSSMSPPTL